jgi:hypothetical protein
MFSSLFCLFFFISKVCFDFYTYDYASQKISDRKRDQVKSYVRGVHRIKICQDERVAEKDRVVEKCLRNHKRQTYNRPFEIFEKRQRKGAGNLKKG